MTNIFEYSNIFVTLCSRAPCDEKNYYNFYLEIALKRLFTQRAAPLCPKKLCLFAISRYNSIATLLSWQSFVLAAHLRGVRACSASNNQFQIHTEHPQTESCYKCIHLLKYANMALFERTTFG